MKLFKKCFLLFSCHNESLNAKIYIRRSKGVSGLWPLQRQRKKNTKTPLKLAIFKILKKKMRFFLMFQGAIDPNI